jgi:hypothetical protein
MGLLFIPQMLYEYREPWWNTDNGKPKNSEKNVLQCHSIHKSHMD